MSPRGLLSHTSLIVFDMDGVLFDTERWAIAAWREAGRRHGWDIAQDVLLQCIGLSAEDTETLLRARFGPGFPYERVKADRVRIGTEQVQRHPAPIKAGAPEALQWLRGRGYALALATSTDRARAEYLLDKADLRRFFGVTVCREDVSRRKPWPDVCIEAARRAHIAPRHCLVIEDSDTGIHAARRAGMRVVFVKDLKPLNGAAARLPIAAFDSLTQMISAMQHE